MSVSQIYCDNPLRNYNYLIVDEPTSQCWVVDPLKTDLIEDQIRRQDLTLKGIFNTHGHYDHTAGNKKLLSKYGCDLITMQHGKEVVMGQNYLARVDYTPGHTGDHYTIVVAEQGRDKYLLSGDTLFNLGVGNCKNGGDRATLAHTITEIYQKYAGDLIVLPGHDYLKNNLEFCLSILPEDEKLLQVENELNSRESFNWLRTLKQEREENLFLRYRSKKLKEALKLKESTDNSEVFLTLRAMRDHW